MRNINFDNPYWLLLAIPLVLAVVIPFIISRNKDNRMIGWTISLVLHLAIVALVTLAVAGMNTTSVLTKTTVYVVADVSHSSSRNLEKIDEVIMRHSNGWKTSRITPVSRSVIRLCIYEMLYMDDIPAAVSLNEAIELVKTFDDHKMRAFVNGLLNGAKNEIEAAKQA